MAKVKMIAVKDFCKYHNVDMAFIDDLEYFDIVRIERVNRTKFLFLDDLPRVEKALRIANDLSVNCAGISTIFNLLQQMDKKEMELLQLKRKLAFYEEI